MTSKRRDSKGRVLRSGESQRSDGKYMFRYTDNSGTRQTVYSWKLVETDRIPSGKRECEALRVIESKVLKDKEDGIRGMDAKKLTLNEAFSQFMDIRTDLQGTTRCNYLELYNSHVRDTIGNKPIGSFQYSSIYQFYMVLKQEDSLAISSIQKINSILGQMFESAVRDDIIRKNPATGVMRDLMKRLKEEPKKKSALTIYQQERLLDYAYASPQFKRYAPLFTVLLGTGMRIGEALGLTWGDIDFDQNVIFVTHSLSYKRRENGKCEYHVSAPKTKSGIRTIPMFQDVSMAFKREKETSPQGTPPFVVDGYKDFVFLNTAGKVYTTAFISQVIQNFVSSYNRDEFSSARKDARQPAFLPPISAHTFRHTFCTRLCENETNLKVIQEVMGHKTIRTTMDVYSDATAQLMQVSFQHLEGKIRLS